MPRFATTLEQQEQIISNLRAELDEVRHELDLAYDLDEEVRQRLHSVPRSLALIFHVRRPLKSIWISSRRRLQTPSSLERPS